MLLRPPGSDQHWMLNSTQTTGVVIRNLTSHKGKSNENVGKWREGSEKDKARIGGKLGTDGISTPKRRNN